MCSGRSIDHALGHVEHHSARPAGGVQARRTCRHGNPPPRTDTAATDRHVRQPSRSRLPKSTPCRANAGSSCVVRTAGCRSSAALPASVDALRVSRASGTSARPPSTPCATATGRAETDRAGSRGCRSASILPAFGRAAATPRTPPTPRAAAQPATPAPGARPETTRRTLAVKPRLRRLMPVTIGCRSARPRSIVKVGWQCVNRRDNESSSTPRFLPSATRSAGSSRRRIPSAVP